MRHPGARPAPLPALLRAGLGRAALIAGLLAAAPASVWAAEEGLPVAAARAAVVSVLPTWASRPPRPEEPEGSGVAVGDGTEILTADHVLGRPLSVRVRTAEGDILPAEIVARDPATDLALLSIETAQPVLPQAGDPPVGDRVCAIGNAFGLDLSVSCGTVSAVRRSGVGFNRIEDFIQTDAPVNPGMSGGALVDAEGRLVGVLSAIFTKESDANIGVNFAVSTALAARALDRLRNEPQVSWPDPGMALEGFPPRGQTGRIGARVRALAAGSPGDRAGLEAGDIIVRAGDRRVRGPADVVAAYALADAGSSLTMTVVRGDRTLEIAVAPIE